MQKNEVHHVVNNIGWPGTWKNVPLQKVSIGPNGIRFPMPLNLVHTIRLAIEKIQVIRLAIGKQAEWVDAFGRQYRLALYQHPMEWTPGVAIPLFDPLKRQEIMEQQVKQGRGRLWVRLDKGAGPDAWFTPGELAMHQEVTLRPVMDGVPPLEIHLMTAQRRLPKGRTGLVTVTPASFVV